MTACNTSHAATADLLRRVHAECGNEVRVLAPSALRHPHASLPAVLADMLAAHAKSGSLSEAAWDEDYLTDKVCDITDSRRHAVVYSLKVGIDGETAWLYVAVTLDTPGIWASRDVDNLTEAVQQARDLRIKEMLLKLSNPMTDSVLLPAKLTI